MRKSIHFIVFIVSLLFTATLTAGEIPQELVYQNKPVDSLCLFEIDEQPIALKTCGINATKDRKSVGPGKIADRGFIGYDYIWPVDKDHTEANAYSYYQYLGSRNHQSIVYTINGTGGSGDFTGISAVKRKGDNLWVTNIVSGDRCNGGVTDAGSQEDGQIYFDVSLTAFDYLDLAKQNPHQLKAYSDLSACAACCAGTAKFVLKTKGNTFIPQLVSVNLPEEKVTPSKDAQGKYQYCFDTQIAKYQAQRKTTLTVKEFNDLVKQINNECFSNSAS